jgi:hypothetical protein
LVWRWQLIEKLLDKAPQRCYPQAACGCHNRAISQLRLGVVIWTVAPGKLDQAAHPGDRVKAVGRVAEGEIDS